VDPLKIRKAIFSIQTEQEFNVLCLEIFRFQSQRNTIYKAYLEALGVDGKKIDHVLDIPFLPIEFFRDHLVYTSQEQPEITFNSSGTTGMQSSRHAVADVSLYEQSFNLAFQQFYGDPSAYRFLALLPSYLERTGSSLIYMAQKLIEKSSFPESGFYLEHSGELIHYLQQSSKKTILLGVSFALLDLAELEMVDNPELVVMETGGMKGRRKELVRAELHTILKRGFGVERIHSEYGMTEMLSQAYSMGEGRFRTPPWAKIMVRDTNDPLSRLDHHQTGGINVIDLANLYSCSFIATQDLGRTHPDDSFEVLGRFDTSDIRGCNLLVL
jgi:phenylacetate-coenzyme A ligase PaaK-like adenylate-forming protein